MLTLKGGNIGMVALAFLFTAPSAFAQGGGASSTGYDQRQGRRHAAAACCRASP